MGSSPPPPQAKSNLERRHYFPFQWPAPRPTNRARVIITFRWSFREESVAERRLRAREMKGFGGPRGRGGCGFVEGCCGCGRKESERERGRAGEERWI